MVSFNENALKEEYPEHLARPLVRKVGKRKWIVEEDFKTPYGITVPKGFVTDGASIPQFMWWFASPAGDLFCAALLHDYMYVKALACKYESDIYFRGMAEKYQVGPIKRWLAYFAVSWFGRGNYKEYM